MYRLGHLDISYAVLGSDFPPTWAEIPTDQAGSDWYAVAAPFCCIGPYPSCGD